jgi:hypothetical protein
MELFDQFIQERVYLKGVSPKTVISYHCAFKAFGGARRTKLAGWMGAVSSSSGLH